jgi:uncharacterized membrane protein YkvA (DUF1232 family)
MRRLLQLWRLSAQDLRLLWFALRHARRPAWLWPTALLLCFYALEPFNVALPLLGVVDDLLILPLVLHLMLKLLPIQIRADFTRHRRDNHSVNRP